MTAASARTGRRFLAKSRPHAAANVASLASLASLAGVAIVCASLASGFGCAEFADPSTVRDLRILAVRSEPSEIVLDVTDPADLSAVMIPDIALSALIVDPRGAGRPVTVSVTACANNPGAISPPNNGGDPTGFPAGGVRTTVGSALCDGSRTEVVIASDVAYQADAVVLARLTPAWIMNAFAVDVFIGPDGRVHGGFDLGMPVVFQLTARAGDDVIRAVKRVTFWARAIRDDQRANSTPALSAVSVYDRRDSTTAEPVPDAVQVLAEGQALAVPADGLWIDPTPGDAEPFVTAVLDRLTGQAIPHPVARETLRYTFHATAGTFSPFETASEPPPGVTFSGRAHIESKYRPPPVAERPADVTIWIVVRDERGGISWVTRALTVAAAGGT